MNEIIYYFFKQIYSQLTLIFYIIYNLQLKSNCRMIPKRYVISLARKALIQTYQECQSKKGINQIKIRNIEIQMGSTRQRYSYENMDNKMKYFYRSEQSFIDFNKDYYQILGVEENAELHIIKQRFYLLAKEHHPDVNSGNQTKFKQINEAYNVLSQENLKKLYDKNRDKGEGEEFNQDNSLGDKEGRKRNLNYEPYSQMSKAQWAVYRNGYMPFNRTDYTNYQQTWTSETNIDFDYKQQMQWRSAYKNMKVEQVKQEMQFRNKLYKKHKQDCQLFHKQKQQYMDKRFSEIGDKVQKFLGKRIRKVYDKYMK